MMQFDSFIFLRINFVVNMSTRIGYLEITAHPPIKSDSAQTAQAVQVSPLVSVQGTTLHHRFPL